MSFPIQILEAFKISGIFKYDFINRYSSQTCLFSLDPLGVDKHIAFHCISLLVAFGGDSFSLFSLPSPVAAFFTFCFSIIFATIAKSVKKNCFFSGVLYFYCTQIP